MRFTNEPALMQILDTKLKQRILGFYLKDQLPLPERELARVLGVSHTAVNKAMKQLAESGILDGMAIGRASVWRLNEKSFLFPIITNLREGLTKTSFDILKTIIKKTIEERVKTRRLVRLRKGASISIYIFGSAADGTMRPNSDFDVLVVFPEKTPQDKMDQFMTETGSLLLEKTGMPISFRACDIYQAERTDAPAWIKDAISNGMRVM